MMGDAVWLHSKNEGLIHSQLREGFFPGFRMHLIVSIPSERQEEQKLGADAGQFPKPERMNVAIKREQWARMD
jgi:hypothetical protein